MFGSTLLLLLVKIQPGAVLSLGPLVSDSACKNFGASDADMDGMHHCDSNPDPDVDAHPGVGLTPIGANAGS